MRLPTGRLRPSDRRALALWLGSWVGVMFFVAVVPRVLPSVFDGKPYLDRWAQWDAVRFLDIATYGYGGVPGEKFDPGWPAFFPGYPLALKFTGLFTGGDYKLAGLVISFFAGGVAALALGRLAEEEVGARPRRRGALRTRLSGWTSRIARDGERLDDRERLDGAEHDPDGDETWDYGDDGTYGGGDGTYGGGNGTHSGGGSGTHRRGVQAAEAAPPRTTVRRSASSANGHTLEAAEEEAADEAGTIGAGAVAAMLASPAAVFLFAGYSESLFLAFALPAWLMAKRGRWAWAALLATPSSAVRITGLFLVLAMIVEYLVGRHGRREQGWRPIGWLVLPFTPLLAYTVYQWGRTGDWMAWQHAQEAGWHRKFTMPWDAFKLTYQSAFETNYEFTLAFRIEVFAAAVGVLLSLYLLYRRRWPELAYVGLQLAALMTSSYYLSIGRATLLWWPLWLGFGTLALRHRWLFGAAVAAAAPFAVLQLLTFTSGGWAG
ncbi:hypothetical protein [Actinomadura rupiterrae]|uniref:hypothetical protein n=1 Tax=Actinomadura rupiterrae TaxID=559627 RepID=UPI0020A3742F|nr:hypothetical protein [Actinomadura rupiterrae]MCP2340528.1 hypothetical protein [Actinomadura rupiterrae]